MKKAKVYSGPYYGQVHTLINATGTIWTLVHDATGTTVRALRCDCEVLP